MFDMGFAEMLVIGIVALLVIGPERLPAVAKKAGIYFARIRRFVSNVKSDVEREFKTDELQRMLRQQQDELSSLKDIVNETRKEVDLDSIEQSIRESTQATIADDKSTAESAETSAQTIPQPEKTSS